MNEPAEHELREIARQLQRHDATDIPLAPRDCGSFANAILALIYSDLEAEEPAVARVARLHPEPIIVLGDGSRVTLTHADMQNI